MAKAGTSQAVLKERFRQVLKRYAAEHNLSTYELASVLGKSQSTIAFWMTGRNKPTRKTMREVCKKLDIPYDSNFGTKNLEDLFFREQVLGFDQLQKRYCKLQHENDGFSALALSVVCAALMFDYLAKQGIQCKLTVEHDWMTIISFPEGYKLENYVIRLVTQGVQGLGYVLEGKRENITLIPWRLIDKKSMDVLVDFLNT